MRGFSFLIFVALTILMWGIYGPVLHVGQEALGDGQRLSRWNPFICVGVAYFLIAVVYPVFMIPRETQGKWSPSGIFWSFFAGSIGAIGALGIILAFIFGGSPVFIMPLVFGFAPVINTVVTMSMSRTIGQASMVFYLGVLVVAIGGAGVMVFKPKPPVKTSMAVSTLQEESDTKQEASNNQEATQKPATPPAAETNEPSATGTADPTTENTKADDATAESKSGEPKTSDAVTTANPTDEIAETIKPKNEKNFLWMICSIALTALCWGSYGPVLHKGQAKMGGSRLRPFLFVGLAYFVIAVALPLMLQNYLPADPGQWNLTGILWSLAAGAAGAVGALGIIYAFNFGGKPIYIMPLVFGGAPVVNTLTSTIADQTYNQLEWPFYLSLFLVIAGAVTVLTTAPRSKPKS